MKPLFTIHVGEYVVGEYIERTFKKVNLWVPARDTGIDLLVTDSNNNKTISLQVKFSRDFSNLSKDPIFKKSLKAHGWWSLNRQKIAASKADCWVFALMGFEQRCVEFVIIKPAELLKRLTTINKQPTSKIIQTYFSVMESKRCWETRGLTQDDKLKIACNQFVNDPRDLSAYLNNWAPIQALAET